MWKKLAVIVTSGALALSMSACGEKDGAKSGAKEGTQDTVSAAPEQKKSDTATADMDLDEFLAAYESCVDDYVAFSEKFKESSNPLSLTQEAAELQQKAEKQLREQGYFRKASIGDFWGLIETRPYMRVCQTYVGTLLMNRKMRLAAKACESMLRLCKNDNLGIRYTLIHLYGYLEEGQAAHKLFGVYDGGRGTRFPLAMALFSYKQGKEEMAQKYLQMLLNNNKDTKKFFSAYGTKKLGAYASKMQPYAYLPDSIEELLLILAEHDYIYDFAHAFFFWAKGAIRGMKKEKVTG